MFHSAGVALVKITRRVPPNTTGTYKWSGECFYLYCALLVALIV